MMPGAMRSSVVLAIGFLMIAAGLPGCQKAPRSIPCHPVSGQIKVDGKVAPMAHVVFHPVASPDGKPFGAAQIADDQGAFRLTTFKLYDGAPEGEYIVTVVWPAYRKGPNGEDLPGPDRLNGRYADPKNSPLRAKVVQGENQIPPFELTSK